MPKPRVVPPISSNDAAEAAGKETAESALAGQDLSAAQRALRRARDGDARADAFHAAVQAGEETARLAPQRWGTRDELSSWVGADPALDLASRNVRVLARGAIRAIELREHVPPDLLTGLGELAGAVRALRPALDRPDDDGAQTAAREAALQAAARATLALERTGNLSVSVLVGQVRATATDLLRVLGMAPREARDAVRAAAERARVADQQLE